MELTLSTDGLRLVLAPDDADSFLATLLGGEISAGLPLAARWSPQDGLTVDGGAGLQVTLATSVTIGPLTVSGLTLELSVVDEIAALVVTTEISGVLGPVRASVADLGLRAQLLPGDQRGAGVVPLGPLSVAIGFQPPSGATLSLDLGAVGGGWVDFDVELGRYTGVLVLTLLGVRISAVVIVDTAPQGPGPWSMFFALFIDVPAVQLGFGFTLTGVGGLFGFDRVLDTEALRSAIRSGSMEAALFPAEPLADAPEVIGELSALFPASTGSYVFGPVVRIGWGTPTLIEAELGVVLSLPDPVVIAVVGSVTSTLPTEELALVAIHADVAGVIDATAGTLAVDAGLHDSYVAGFALTGGMALRGSFLDEPSFLLAMGGFHPHFDAPDGFPELPRLSLAVSVAPVIDISFDCYLAIASNTVQFGASFHLSAEVEGFGIEGGTSFDGLVGFSPFSVATNLSWLVKVTAGDMDLFGVWLTASVEGPNPWLVLGTAHFEILGVEEHLRIDEQIGGHVAEPAPQPADLLTELTGALGDEGAWSVVAGPSPGVVVAAGAGDGELVALPDGVLAVSQRTAPLGIRLDKAGDESLDTYDTFDLELADGSMSISGTVRDWFAPGYFFDLGNTEALSSPSFELLASGTEFGGGDPVAGTARTGTLDFEQIVRDPQAGEEATGIGEVGLDADGRPELVTVMAGAARTASAGPFARPAFAVADDPGAVSLAPSGYAVTDRDSGRVRARAGSWSGAHQSQPGGKAATTIVPSWEAPR